MIYGICLRRSTTSSFLLRPAREVAVILGHPVGGGYLISDGSRDGSVAKNS